MKKSAVAEDDEGGTARAWVKGPQIKRQRAQGRGD